ncbi:hypothetical protein [Tenacibaculum jejuense]|uniref:Probable lipoprotein n=1 Tax=Tenacibaculum jejuense TaxID=584609 RepID=A0A238UD24_9FLAO|nr:hypothetical protein [Tenacibaculum jejuense]SNR17113.1 Probable lipoprotein precursor [Tenacibaculum jejuense]
MKTIFKLKQFVILFVLVFASCQQEQLVTEETINSENSNDLLAKENTEEIVKVQHNYDYRGKKFSVVYVLNTIEEEVLEVAGDVELAKEIFGREDAPQNLLFKAPEKGDLQNTIEVKVFDTTEEVDEFSKTVAKGFSANVEAEEVKGRFVAKKDCFDSSVYGNGNFYFYYHSFYNAEMTGIRRTNRRYYQDWSLGGYNDQMTSLIATKPYGTHSYVRLFQHSCYRGRTLSFYAPTYYTAMGVPNLSYYTLSGWWFWRKSWNDKVSSYKVWNW